MVTPAEEQRERMSKAMGAAFLAHQVAGLERSVESITFSRDSRLYDPSSESRRGRGAAGGSGRAGAKREVRVLDASALVHALPLLKKWIREDRYQLVVPLEVLSILDQLKKAPNPLHDLGRDATRFLETQLGIARQITSTPTGSHQSGAGDTRVRLRAQAAGEEISWSEVEKLFRVPDDYVPLPLPEGYVPDEDDEGLPIPRAPPSASDIPRTLRSTIQCALHFHANSSSPSAPPVIVYNSFSLDYTPPPVVIVAPAANFRSNGTGPTPIPVNFLALSSGNAITYYLSTFFGVSSRNLTSVEVSSAREWARGQAALVAPNPNNTSRGRGRGRGDGTNKKSLRGGGATRNRAAEERLTGDSTKGRGRGGSLFVP